MINIFNNSSDTKYISWIPSDRGALISAYGTIKNSNSISKDMAEIYNSLDDTKPIFNISVNHNLADIHIIRYPSDEYYESYIEWYLKNLYGNKEYDLFDHYQYPLASDKMKLLNISIRKNIKSCFHANDIIVNNGEVRSLSLDIFSAECGARHWFKVDKDYVIWKIEKRNKGTIMIIKGNTLASLFSIKIHNKKYVIDSVVLNNNLARDFLEYINSLICDDKTNKNNFGKIFYYNGDCSKSAFIKFKEIINKDFCALNIFDVINTSIKKPNDNYTGTSFAEVGIGFSGIDV